jgi:hypothetical protein
VAVTDPGSGCEHAPFTSYLEYTTEDLGTGDKHSEVFVLTCRTCGQEWLKVLLEEEHRSRSGRWWLVPVPAEREQLSAANAVAIVERSAWCYVGGSYYDGRIQRRAAPIACF